MSQSTIEVRLNGDPIRCPEGLSLLQLLELRGYKPQLVVADLFSFGVQGARIVE